MKLLVPVDGSDASRRAVDHAVWLIRGRTNARLLLLNVQNDDTLGLSDIDPETGSEAELAARESRKVLRAAAAVCEQADVPFETRAEFGPVCETIVQVAQEAKADQIVMGSRGLGRLRGALLGSVATGVIAAVEIPVTVVKRSSRLPGQTEAERSDPPAATD